MRARARGPPAAGRRWPCVRPGRHEELVPAGVGGVDLLVVDDADLHVIELQVMTDARHGDPVTEIVAVARKTGAGIIAMTTHGRSGFRRLLYGSVAERVLRQTEISVFMVRLAEHEVSATKSHQAA